MKRTDFTPPLNKDLWEERGKLYFTSREKIDSEIQKNGHSDNELRAAMGFGFSHLEELKNGEGVDRWTAVFVQNAIGPKRNRTEPFTYSPKK